SSSLASADVPEEESKREEWSLRNDPRRWGRSQVDFPKMHAGGLDVAFFIVYVGQGSLDDEGFTRADEVARTKFDAILRMCERFPEEIELARTADDVERIAASGKLVACIGIENGYAMGQDISRIAEFHALGARYMSLTHNRHSHLGDSHTPEEPLHGGITDLGRDAVRELNRVGILVDVSHASKTTMMEATALSKAPVIASHSGVDAIRVHGRNLDDEQLRALAANGGVIQCVAFSSYVTDTSKRDSAIRAARTELGLGSRRGAGAADTSKEGQEKRQKLRERVKAIEAQYPPSDVSDFADHIDHAVKIAGIEHVAISSDFDGGGGIVGWNTAAETFNVTLELCRRGYSDADVAKLWSGNTLRIWREVEAVAARLQAEDK
ncbi:MAG: membrane dipeptidase, partial [Planctomycetota bacterium]